MRDIDRGSTGVGGITVVERGRGNRVIGHMVEGVRGTGNLARAGSENGSSIGEGTIRKRSRGRGGQFVHMDPLGSSTLGVMHTGEWAFNF